MNLEKALTSKNFNLFESVVRQLSSDKSATSIRLLVKYFNYSRRNRRYIGRTLVKYVGEKSIKFLLEGFDSLSQDEKFERCLILAKLGFIEAIENLIKIRQQQTEEDIERQKRIDLFFTNYSHIVLEKILELHSHDDPFIRYFAIKTTAKFCPQVALKRLEELVSDDSVDEHIRGLSINQISHIDTQFALALINKYPISTKRIVRNIVRRFYEEKGEEAFEVLKHLFVYGNQVCKYEVAIQLSDFNDNDAYEYIHELFLSLLEQFADEKENLEEPTLVEKFKECAIILTSNNNFKVFEIIRQLLEDKNLCQIAKDILVKSGTSLGLELMLQDFKRASTNERFPIMARIFSVYWKKSLPLLPLIKEDGDPRLISRAEEFISNIWEGSNLNQLLEKFVKENVEAPVSPEPVHQIRRRISTSFWSRNKSLADYIKDLYGYKCQTCGIVLINQKTGQRYIEVHHIKPLSDGGPDSKNNMICLCPTCHKLFNLGCMGISKKRKIYCNLDTPYRTLDRLEKIPEHKISNDMLYYHWTERFVPIGTQFFEDE